jgi:predicted dehydrogenase
MTKNQSNEPGTRAVDLGRRRILSAAGAGAIASTLGGVLGGASGSARAAATKSLRWGVVGTGGIANSMAPMIRLADDAELAAVSSRHLETAKEFATQHDIGNAFDSWEDMLAFDGIDAVYVATPTFVREQICIAAANAGKHVLGEKPFASLASLRRITAACRENGVGFMDGTHFVHHPRTPHIRATIADKLGWARSVDSAFEFGLSDTGNIRYRPDQEPLGAIGDAGWYNMRAAVEFLAPDVELAAVSAYMRRHEKTHAAISGCGVITFSDGSSTTWNCGFESGALLQDVRIAGAGGAIKFDDFVHSRPDKPAHYDYLVGAFGGGKSEGFDVPADKPAAALMFEDFAAMAGDKTRFEASVHASERTQTLLDACWESAVANEAG